MNFAGLPLHVLVVHAAVVLTPMTAVLVGVFAVVPRWRWLTRWPSVVAAVATMGALFVAKVSGAALLRSRAYLLQSQVLAGRIHTHQTRANQLVLAMLVLTLLTLAGAWLLGGPSPLVSGRGEKVVRGGVVHRVLPALLVLGALVVLVWVVLTGDAGARAVWGR